MEIKVTQEKLAKALNSVSRVAAGARATLPILNNVLIRVDNGNLTLTTTNLDMAIVAYLPATGAKNGVLTVPARLMAEFVGALPRGETVELVAEGEKLVIKSKGYSSNVNGVAADDFPELPEIDEEKAAKFTLSADEFKEGVAQAMIAVGNDMTRPALTGLLLRTMDGELCAAGTDGYRIAEKVLMKKFPHEISAIVPAPSIRSVLALLDDGEKEVEVVLDDAQIRFRLGDVELTSKLLSGSFPDYRKLFPEKCEVWVKLDRAELLRVTKLTAIFAREVNWGAWCATDAKKGVFTISAVANEVGENNSEIKTEISGDTKMVINTKYMLDVLNVMDAEKVELGMSSGAEPMMVKGDEGYTYMLMQLRK